MQAADFTSDSPGRLVPAQGGALAFVPEPMPMDVPLGTAEVRLLSMPTTPLAGWPAPRAGWSTRT